MGKDLIRDGLQTKLKAIFDFDKVTFDNPSDSQEQEAVFVQIADARVKLKDGRQIARVTGMIRVFANSSKLPYGYFSKCLAEAEPEDTKDLFFHNFEENKGTFQNIAERSLEFVYFFDGQYDPNVGSITSINLEFAESQ